MDLETQLKVQALLDGELPKSEAKEVSRWAERDREAGALLAELRQTRAALAGFEGGVRMPESREFFWSKIEREIERAEAPAAAPAPLFTRLRRFLMPATAMALLAIAGFVATREAGWPLAPAGPEAETSEEDSDAFTYHDYTAGTTLVWLSYPADYELANEDEGAIVD